MGDIDVYRVTKKDKLFIHAGFHKTGTTTIQYSLDRRRVFKDFQYLDLKNPIHSLAISCIVGARREEPYKFIIANETGEHEFLTHSKEHTITLLDNIISSNKSSHIISGEDIAKFSLEELITLNSLAQCLYFDVEVIIYVRPPFSHIVSSYQEMLKSGSLPPVIQKSYLNYEIYIDNLDKAFGKNNVKLYKFDRSELFRSDILLDFLHRIGADGADIPHISTNTSLSKESFSLLYVYAKFHEELGYPSLNFRNDIFLNWLKGLDETKFELNYGWAQQVINDCEQEIAWVEARGGFSLQENIINSESAFKDEMDILNYALKVYPKLELLLSSEYSNNSIDYDDRYQVYQKIIESIEMSFNMHS